MREWKFKKQDLNCTLTINDEAIIKIKINDDKPFNVKNLDRGCVYFYDSHYLTQLARSLPPLQAER